MKLNKLFYSIMLGCATLIGLTACNDDENENGVFTLDAPVIENIEVPSATASAHVNVSQSDLESGAVRVMTYGFCYSTSPAPTIYKSTVSSYLNEEGVSRPVLPDNSGNISATITGLENNTVYYVRAFATLYPNGVVYSEEVSFTTSAGAVPTELESYVAPTYADNYTSFAGWAQRNQWNLANVHDPSVMKADDGYYYMYQTDASYGNAHDGHGHFHARRSKDLVNWEYLGATMNDSPAWVKTKLNEIRAAQGLAPIDNPSYGYWAPVARRVSAGKYRMYYCIVVNNFIKTGALSEDKNFDNSWTERAFIGMMETTNPAGNTWEDKGYVVCSSTDREMDWSRSSLSDWSGYFKWNAIDPSYIIDKSGEHWLIYGSWHSGIVAMQLDASTGKPLKTLGNPWDTSALPDYGQLVATRTAGNRWQGSEAPEIIYNPATEYYYMFLAYDELSVAYNTRVVRSKNITGPYLGIDGTNVTNGGNALPVVTHPYKFSNSDGWVGISHCAIFDDGNGNWFYASQGRLPKDIASINASNAVMMGQVRSIRWTADGWPVVMPERYGAVPKVEIKESELLGNWEHIDLGYSAGNQKVSSTMTLAADHTITAGTWKGATWSYDAANQVLTANGVQLYLQREADWEATPRTHTIVYAGYTTSKTYWGKKSK